MNMIDLKRNIFLLYEDARILFNDYYNDFFGSKEEYSEEDIERILRLLERIKTNVENIEEELEK